MPAGDLRKAFNEEATPRYTCQLATMAYDRSEGAELQILTFSGIGADGNSFEVRSEKFNPNLDPVQIARATAKALLAKQEPLT